MLSGKGAKLGVGRGPVMSLFLLCLKGQLSSRELLVKNPPSSNFLATSREANYQKLLSLHKVHSSPFPH